MAFLSALKGVRVSPQTTEGSTGRFPAREGTLDPDPWLRITPYRQASSLPYHRRTQPPPIRFVNEKKDNGSSRHKDAVISYVVVSADTPPLLYSRRYLLPTKTKSS